MDFKYPSLRVILCFFPLTVSTLYGQCEVAHLTFPDANPYDRFGSAVAVDDIRVLVGAHDAVGIGPDTGAAYIYREGATGWDAVATLAATDGMAYDLFGLSVDLQGDTAIIGAPSRDDLGAYSGAAYVFHFDGESWVEETKLLASDGAEDDGFGVSVAIDGDRIVVGAFAAATLGVRTGAAYVFRRTGGTWIEEQKLTASDPQLFDQFGTSVAIAGDVTLIGSPWHSDAFPSAGSAYVYRYNGVVWEQETKLVASDAGDGDFFGYAVDLDGDVAAIGAVENCLCSVPPGPLGSGTGYVFRHDGIRWKEEAKLLPAGGQPEQWFGASISISGDVLVVGAWNANGVTFGTGAAYVFRDDGGAWSQTAMLHASDAAGSDVFGDSVSVRGNLAVVGAPLHDDGGDGSGAAYVFSIAASGCGALFARGDCNGDGRFDIADPIYHLEALFRVSGVTTRMSCRDACDSDDDGSLNIADPVIALNALFGTPAVPLPPPMNCGPDPTADGLSCLQHDPCL